MLILLLFAFLKTVETVYKQRHTRINYYCLLLLLLFYYYCYYCIIIIIYLSHLFLMELFVFVQRTCELFSQG